MGAYDEPEERTILDAVMNDFPDRRKLIDAFDVLEAFLKRHCGGASDYLIADDPGLPKTCNVLGELSVLLRKTGEATDLHEEVDFFERAGWFSEKRAAEFPLLRKERK